ncbi:MAG: DUF2490 domain-containing protein [Desulfobacterales bacterium]
MQMRKFWLSITLLIGISTLSPSMVFFAHGADFQTWSDIATIYKFSDRWRYDGDQGIRGVLSDSDFTLLYFRLSVRYRANSWFTIHGGIRFFRNYIDDDDDIFKIGPWQGLRFGWPMSRHAFSHYLRM